jgi:hypothetical protein
MPDNDGEVTNHHERCNRQQLPKEIALIVLHTLPSSAAN